MASAAIAYPLEAVQVLDRELSNSKVSVQLEVQMLTGRIVVPRSSFSESAPLASVKESVKAAIGVPLWHQKLIWQTTALRDEVILGDLSLPPEGAILQLVISLPPEEQIGQARELLRKAAAALDVVDARALSELKNFARPPAGVDLVLEAVMHLRAGIDPAIAVDSQGRVKDRSWKGSRNMIQNPKKFIVDLKEFKTVVENGSLPAGNVRAACRIRDSMGYDFRYASMCYKSPAAAGLVVWVLNTIQYYEVCNAIRAEFEGFDIMTEIRDQLAM